MDFICLIFNMKVYSINKQNTVWYMTTFMTPVRLDKSSPDIPNTKNYLLTECNSCQSCESTPKFCNKWTVIILDLHLYWLTVKSWSSDTAWHINEGNVGLYYYYISPINWCFDCFIFHAVNEFDVYWQKYVSLEAEF